MSGRRAGLLRRGGADVEHGGGGGRQWVIVVRPPGLLGRRGRAGAAPRSGGAVGVPRRRRAPAAGAHVQRLGHRRGRRSPEIVLVSTFSEKSETNR